MKQVAKAIYAGAIAGLGSLAAVLVGDVGFDAVTAGQWVTIVLAALVSAGGVYGISNAPKPA
jgi:hypothetical protein